MSGDKLAAALALVGGDEKRRMALVDLLREFERESTYAGNVRDDITGPIVAALHSEVETMRKRLKGGLLLDFRPTGRITQDFIMSTPAEPDHVWEPQTTRLLLHLSRLARHVVIGGAYFGDHALLMAREMAASGGTVHAFEPNAENSRLLAHNAKLNKLENVRAHRLGLWDRTSKMKLVGEDALASSAVVAPGEDPGTESFDAVAIDDYATQLDAPVGLIMLDIEGGELLALQGARAQLERPAGEAPNLVFEIHNSYVDWSDGLHNTPIVKYLASLGYEIFAVRDAHTNVDLEGHPIELIPAAEVYLEGPPHGFNMLGVKDRSLVADPLFRECRGVSPKYLFHKDPSLFHPLGWAGRSSHG